MKTLPFLKSIVLCALCVFFINTGKAQNLESKIDKILNNQFKKNETGVAALVAKNGKVIYRKAFGKANLELDVNMTPNNVFEVGSITKQFTAVSILMLLEEGKLSLEDDITKFIPDYPTNGQKITIHHLLTHTSGIKSYTSMQEFGKVMTLDKSPLKFIDFFKNEPMDFNPGEKYKYNNSGYFILGYIIEKVSGLSYAKFLQERIFDKIDMKNSYFGSHTKLIKNRASGYQKRDEFSNAQYISLTLPYAAGSVMSTVDDMLKWQTAITGDVFVKESTIDKAFTNYTLNNGDKINYGYGWSLNEISDIATIEHGGAIPGYLSMGVFVPSKNVYVILFSNCGCKSPTDAALEIAALAIDKPRVTEDNVVKLTNEQLNKWVGTYKFTDDALRYITLKDGQLYSQRKGSSQEFKIYPTSPNTFSFKEGFIAFDFSLEEGKKIVLFKNRIHKFKGVFIDEKAPKVKDVITIAEDVLKKYDGAYELQPGFVITVTSKRNQLFAQATGQPQFELFAETETTFYLKVVKASVEFHKNDEGIVNSLTLNQGGRAMKAIKK
ncbi:serine hydrolase [Polaribacter ponticola]|uniref:Serine hydrolase n=1 Tax=Polaribacter ponticola TaxID=2978475 RepID=A0ABT5S4U7_9FLAO|nr:serine hydrolase [Polaribacter sp. MSW5]MDD7913132.1 serine hydrolase [Polaribacter sp. MSW5]